MFKTVALWTFMLGSISLCFTSCGYICSSAACFPVRIHFAFPFFFLIFNLNQGINCFFIWLHSNAKSISACVGKVGHDANSRYCSLMQSWLLFEIMERVSCTAEEAAVASHSEEGDWTMRQHGKKKKCGRKMRWGPVISQLFLWHHSATI